MVSNHDLLDRTQIIRWLQDGNSAAAFDYVIELRHRYQSDDELHASLLREIARLESPLVAQHLLSHYQLDQTQAVSVRTGLAHLAYSAQSYAACLQILESVLKSQTPVPPENLVLFAKALQKCGHADVARNILQNVLESLPSEDARHALQDLELGSGKIKRDTIDARLILFVSESPKARMLKMAQVLCQNDWRVVLLCGAPPNFETVGLFEEVILFKNAQHALFCASSFSPRAIHLFSPMADATCIAFIKEKLRPTIFDGYDFIEGLITADCFREVIPLQRFCMEQADALICRDLRVRFLSRNFNYKLPDKKLFFMEYCWNQPLNVSIKPRPEQGIHVLSCGFVATAKHGHEQDWGYFEVGSMLSNQGIHFHLYPHPIQAQDPNFHDFFSDFIERSRVDPYFHFHNPVPMDQSIEEMSKYHLGVNISMTKLCGRPMLSYTDAHLRYCSSARNIEYLDAGLGVLSQDNLTFQYRMLKRYGVALNTTLELLQKGKEILQALVCDPRYMQGIARARAAYALSHHAPRLIRFYESM